MSAFGMKVMAYDPFVNSNFVNINVIEIKKSINEVYEKADYISIHSPLNG